MPAELSPSYHCQSVFKCYCIIKASETPTCGHVREGPIDSGKRRLLMQRTSPHLLVHNPIMGQRRFRPPLLLLQRNLASTACTRRLSSRPFRGGGREGEHTRVIQDPPPGVHENVAVALDSRQQAVERGTFRSRCRCPNGRGVPRLRRARWVDSAVFQCHRLPAGTPVCEP